MTTTEQVAAEVLAEHEDTIDSTDDSIMAVCTCGEVHVVWIGQGAPPIGHQFYLDSFAAHRAHLASVLAARLDDGLAAKVRELADGWEDCGDEDCCDGCWFVRRLRKLVLDQPHTGTNP